jgi:hypothetical protein
MFEHEARLKALRAAALAVAIEEHTIQVSDTEWTVRELLGECAVDDGSGDLVRVWRSAFAGEQGGWQAMLVDRHGLLPRPLGRELVEAAGFTYHGPNAVYASSADASPYLVSSLFTR